MRKQIQGIALILFSILLALAFETMGIKYAFSLKFIWFYIGINWIHIFLAIGTLGLVMVFWKSNIEK